MTEHALDGSRSGGPHNGGGPARRPAEFDSRPCSTVPADPCPHVVGTRHGPARFRNRDTADLFRVEVVREEGRRVRLMMGPSLDELRESLERVGSSLGSRVPLTFADTWRRWIP